MPVFFYLDALDQDMTIAEFLEELDVVTEEHVDGFWELSLASTQTLPAMSKKYHWAGKGIDGEVARHC